MKVTIPIFWGQKQCPAEVGKCFHDPWQTNPRKVKKTLTPVEQPSRLGVRADSCLLVSIVFSLSCFVEKMGHIVV